MEDYILKTLDEIKIQLTFTTLTRIGIILALMVAALVIMAIVQKKIKAKVSREDIRRSQFVRIGFRLGRIAVVLTGIIAILRTVGIDFTGLSVLAGVLVLLLALAVKDALQDIFAGIVIMSDKYFSVGDAVEFEGRDGIVISFTARTTKIKFLDDHSIMSVANRHISKIRKLTHLVDIDLPLPYELSGKDALAALRGICDKINALEGVERCELKGTQEFGASAILYKLRFYCDPGERPDIRRAALRVIQEDLEAADIHIPYQQIDVHTR